MGNRFRLIVNEVQAVKPKQALPKLPVARVLWKPLPDMQTACSGWILAGGAHHTAYSQNLNSDCLQSFAEMAKIEMVLINKHSSLYGIKNELRWNEVYYR
jgi:L-arabinose isomerase